MLWLAFVIHEIKDIKLSESEPIGYTRYDG